MSGARSRQYFPASKPAAAQAARWWHLASVDLPNGDQVGVVERWKYPSPLDRITSAHMHKVRSMAAAGNYRKDPRADDWIGRAVAKVADLNPEV